MGRLPNAPPEIKIRLQRLIFPEGVLYQYSGFSNTKISPVFEVINSFAVSDSKDVTQRVWHWNKIFSEFGLLCSTLNEPQNSYSAYSL